MATSYTYAQLETSVKNFVEDDGTAFDTEWDNILKLGEDMVLRDLDLEIFDSEQSITLAQDVQTVTKPTNTIAGRTVWFTGGDGKRVTLQWKTYSFLQDYWPTPADTGVPKYIAELSETQWIVVPTPAVNRSGKAIVIKRPVSLVTDTGGTWLSTRVGDLLFMACMAKAKRYLKFDESARDWEGEYKNALPMMKRELRALMRQDSSPLAPMPSTEGKPEK